MELQENVEDHLNARYVAVAGLTLMIWTHLTTLDDEIRYISTVTFAFVALPRIVPCTTQLPGQCQRLIISLGVTALALIGACDLLFLLRTWAIYNRTRVSLICLIILLAVTHLPTLAIGAVWMMKTLHVGQSGLYPVIPGCFLESTAPEEFWKVVIPSVIYNTVLSGASMYRIWSYHHRALTTPLISLLIRDGIVYYVIILAYLFNGFFLFHKRLTIVTIEGRFITWVVAVTCAQMQLNLRNAVYHVPEYVTSYYQSQAVVGIPNGRRDPPHRPGLDTIIFGGTATELERKHGKRSVEYEIEEEGRQYSHAIELVTTSVHVPQRKRPKLITASADFSPGKQSPLSPQLRPASSFQHSPSLSRPHNVDTTAIPNATDEGHPLSPTSNAHSEPSSRWVARTNTSSGRVIRTALSFDSKYNWGFARPTSSSSAVVSFSKPKKQIRNLSQSGIPLGDTSEIPSPRDLEPPLQRNSPR